MVWVLMKFCKPAILRFKLRFQEGSRGQQSKPTDRKENWQDHQDSPLVNEPAWWYKSSAPLTIIMSSSTQLNNAKVKELVKDSSSPVRRLPHGVTPRVTVSGFAGFIGFRGAVSHSDDEHSESTKRCRKGSERLNLMCFFKIFYILLWNFCCMSLLPPHSFWRNSRLLPISGTSAFTFW